MSKYKVGDKIVFTVTGTTEMKDYKFYVLNDNSALWESRTDKYTEPLSAYTAPLAAKIRRQAAEITRLLRENKELKNEKQELTRERNQLMGRCGGLSAAKIKAFNNGRLAGQNEAWELARKVTSTAGGLSSNELVEIFNAFLPRDILSNNTYPEAAAKVAEWEKAKEEIKVGDVVSREGLYGVVKSVSDDWLNGITASGISFQWLKRKCTKTGRHIDIDGFLRQIGGE